MRLKDIFYFFFVKLPKIIKGLKNNNLLFVYHGKFNNFGDQLSPVILDHYGFTTVFAHYKPKYSFSGKANLVSVGTLLQNTPTDFDGVILGTGSNNLPLSFPFAKILAVRGKLTLQNIENFDNSNNIVIGDPGLLVSKIFKAVVNKKYKLGIVPHFVDKKDPILKTYMHRFKRRAFIVDVQRNPASVIKDIKSCENIISSSLHGLVVADAYDIPNIMYVIRRNISSEHDHKYRDYYSAFDSELDLIEIDGTESMEYLLSKVQLRKDQVNQVKNNLHHLFSNLKVHIGNT